MTMKKPPKSLDKISRVYRIKATIYELKRTKLVISYHYQKRNHEYLSGCKKRGIKPNKNRLFNNQIN